MFKQGNGAPGESLSVFTEVTGELRVCVNRAKQSTFYKDLFLPASDDNRGEVPLL